MLLWRLVRSDLPLLLECISVVIHFIGVCVRCYWEQGYSIRFVLIYVHQESFLYFVQVEHSQQRLFSLSLEMLELDLSPLAQTLNSITSSSRRPILISR
jgi:hypothetical protein